MIHQQYTENSMLVFFLLSAKNSAFLTVCTCFKSSTILDLFFFAVGLPPSRPEAVLSALDLAAPPLVPMVLHGQDKANLTQYFRSLWSVAADRKSTFLNMSLIA